MLNHENDSAKKVVGIIGGMGPGATALLFQKLIDYTDAKSDSEHIHVIIDNNTSIPDRTTAILAGEDTPAKYIYDVIQKELKVPVINMIAETAKVCLEHGYTKIGILATTGTCNTHTYDKELQKFGIEAIYPDEEGQNKVMEIIYDQVKAGRKIDASIIDQTLKKMAAKGAQAFILGCTELPFAIKNGDFGYHFLDSLDILAKKTIELAGYCLKNK